MWWGGGGWVTWVEDGHISTPYDSTQGQAEQRCSAQQLLSYNTLCTTVDLLGRVRLAVPQPCSVAHLLTIPTETFQKANMAIVFFKAQCSIG
jgi:hypothetical protein